MKNRQPTKDEIREFWEWCGIEERFDTNDGIYYYHYPNHTCDIELPPIDLINLLKWAVSRMWVVNIHLEEGLFWVVEVAHPEFGKGEAIDEDLTLALFWALRELQVRGG